MTLREKFLSIGYTNEQIDRMVEDEYNNRVKLLPQTKTFFDTRVGKLLSTDWTSYIMNKLIHYKYVKMISKEKQLDGFTGDKSNLYEVWRYNSTHNIMPIKTIDNGNDIYTHEYEDGTIINIRVNLSGICSDEDFKNLEIYRKELLADYFNIDAEQILKMTNEEITELVKQNELSKCKTKKILFNKFK